MNAVERGGSRSVRFHTPNIRCGTLLKPPRTRAVTETPGFGRATKPPRRLCHMSGMERTAVPPSGWSRAKLGKLMQPRAAWLSAAILAGSRNHPGAQLSHTVSLRSRPSASRTIQAPMRSPSPVAGGGSHVSMADRGFASLKASLKARLRLDEGGSFMDRKCLN